MGDIRNTINCVRSVPAAGDIRNPTLIKQMEYIISFERGIQVKCSFSNEQKKSDEIEVDFEKNYIYCKYIAKRII